jgi:uncharacterized protein involved in exopolysaccharide biosynthesis
VALTYRKNRKDIVDSAVDAGAARPQLTDPSQGEFPELEAAAELSTSAYDNFRHALRQMEATRQQYLPGVNASLINPASAPLRASSPNPALVLVISTLLGIVIGMLRDLSDSGSAPSRPKQA